MIPLPSESSRPRRANPSGAGGEVVPLGGAGRTGDSAESATTAEIDAGSADLERRPAGWESAVAETLAFMRRRLAGEYEVDEYGYDSDFTEHVVGPALAPLYEHWLRVDVAGIENVPAEGRCAAGGQSRRLRLGAGCHHGHLRGAA